MKRFEYINFTVETSEKKWLVNYKNENLEYHDFFEPLMAYLGSEGWELVSVLPLTSSYKPWFIEISMVYTGSLMYHFKREITQGSEEVSASIYESEISELRQIDKKSHEVNLREKAVDSINNFASMDDLTNHFEQLGYMTTMRHKDRMIFALGLDEVRFDRNSETNRWNKA